MNSYHFIIVGSRTFNDYELAEKIINKVIADTKPDKIEIISGEAQGADKLAAKYAKLYGLEYNGYPAKWKEFGKKAGIIRNIDMLNIAMAKDTPGMDDKVMYIMLWNGSSMGTFHDISLAKKYNIDSVIYNYTTGSYINRDQIMFKY